MKRYDEKSEEKTSRPLLWVVVALLIIFILMLAGAFYLKSKIKMPSFPSRSSSLSLDENISKQLEDQIGESIVSIRISEDELSSILNANSEEFPLKKASVKITPEKIILSGKTSNSSLSFKVDVGIVPKVSEGKVVFEIKEIKTGGVSAPKVVTDEVNKNLSSYLSQFNLNDDVQVTEVKLYQDYLIATGERKA